MDIKKKADALVRKHQTRNPFELILGLNVILVFAPLTGVRGFYQYFQRNNIIYIDENLPPHEQAFVCAHELGHMFLHKKANAILWIHVRISILTDTNWKQISLQWIFLSETMLFLNIRNIPQISLHGFWGIRKNL